MNLFPSPNAPTTATQTASRAHHPTRTVRRSRLVATLLGACLGTAVIGSGCRTETRSLAHEVDPFIGTGGHGHTYPGATSPFGMVQLSPDTRLEGWDGCGGYHITDSVAYGFSHTHLQGTGVSDYGDVLLMPCTRFAPENAWRDRIKSSLANETAHAGYYACDLVDHGIRAELTTTPRVGIHRYTLREPDTVSVVVDLAHRDELMHYSMEPLDAYTVVGHRVSDNWAKEQHVYFAMRFDRPFVWQDQMTELARLDTLADGTLQQEMAMVPVFLMDFGVIDALNVHVGLSFCDVDGALKNLEAETAGNAGFDHYLQKNEARWNDQLGRILVEGGSPSDRAVFYTALYHATTVPNLASDVDGRYRGTDLRVHQLGEAEGEHYTVFSLWDTYRALHPLLAWIEPDRTRDMVRTMVRMFEEGGQLPVWELAANYTGCMIGYHSVPVIADASAWGISGWNEATALRAMVQAADSMHLGLDAYARLGYIPSDHEHESVSKTLEYAFDDACIARTAFALGERELGQRFQRRANAWRNLVHPESHFIQPKRQGAWVEGFDPREVNFNFTEANAWQYLFAVPHDIQGQATVMGGDEAYFARLQELFTAPVETTGREQPDITGLIGQYAHGNEPSHHVAYLASYVGHPEATAEWVSTLCNEMYSDQPDGLCGNEDCGQMSAWYVWSALGMYPVEPGSGQVVLGSPRFRRAVVQPANRGTKFEMRARGLTETAIYPTGTRWHSPEGTSTPVQFQSFIATHALADGGLLEVLMASKPHSSFGVAPEDRPTSAWSQEGFVAVPAFDAPRAFRGDSAWVALDHLDQGARLEWSEDGGQTWQLGSAPWAITASCELHARAILGNDTSAVVSHRMTHVDHAWTLSLATPPDNQYTAGGPDALIDGIRGGNDFRTGEWQGYWGTSMEATLDLGNVASVKAVELGALQDIKPWIWMPKHVHFYRSDDGESFDLVATASPQTDVRQEAVTTEVFRCNVPMKTRHLRVVAEAHGPIPDWHLGRGNNRWMFLDELAVELEDAPAP